MKKVYVVFLAIVFSLVMVGLSYSANEKPAAPKTPAVSAAKAAPLMGQMPPKKLPRPGFGVIAGSISKIDKAGPDAVKVEVKSESDNTLHTVEITNATNITKVTDTSELKVGDAVRMMTRKIDDKEVAMSVVTGKIQNMPGRRFAAPGTLGAGPAQGQAPKAAVKAKK